MPWLPEADRQWLMAWMGYESTSALTDWPDLPKAYRGSGPWPGFNRSHPAFTFFLKSITRTTFPRFKNHSDSGCPCFVTSNS